MVSYVCLCWECRLEQRGRDELLAGCVHLSSFHPFVFTSLWAPWGRISGWGHWHCLPSVSSSTLEVPFPGLSWACLVVMVAVACVAGACRTQEQVQMQSGVGSVSPFRFLSLARPLVSSSWASAPPRVIPSVASASQCKHYLHDHP